MPHGGMIGGMQITDTLGLKLAGLVPITSDSEFGNIEITETPGVLTGGTGTGALKMGTDQVIHLKSGNIYTYLGRIWDSTNGRENQRMILYKSITEELFAREETEFWEKFKYAT